MGIRDEDQVDAFHAEYAKTRRKYGFKDDPPADTWRGDDEGIGRKYKKLSGEITALFIIIAASAYFLELKYLLAVGILTIGWGLMGLDARLYDLCVRQRRTNMLLRELLQHFIYQD